MRSKIRRSAITRMVKNLCQVSCPNTTGVRAEMAEAGKRQCQNIGVTTSKNRTKNVKYFYQYACPNTEFRGQGRNETRLDRLSKIWEGKSEQRLQESLRFCPKFIHVSKKLCQVYSCPITESRGSWEVPQNLHRAGFHCSNGMMFCKTCVGRNK